MPKPRCVCGCGQRATNQHHVVYQQEIRHHPDVAMWDKRNLVPMAFDCHMAHHNRSRVLPLEVLPDPVFEFAAEVMGPAAFYYLHRRYSGDDSRLEALLAEA